MLVDWHVEYLSVSNFVSCEDSQEMIDGRNRVRKEVTRESETGSSK